MKGAACNKGKLETDQKGVQNPAEEHQELYMKDDSNDKEDDLDCLSLLINKPDRPLRLFFNKIGH